MTGDKRKYWQQISSFGRLDFFRGSTTLASIKSVPKVGQLESFKFLLTLFQVAGLAFRKEATSQSIGTLSEYH